MKKQFHLIPVSFAILFLMKLKRVWIDTLSVVLLLILSVTIAMAVEVTGFTDILHYNGHLYAITRVADNWYMARDFARDNGGHLVTVNDAAETQFLNENYGYGQPWIGLNYTEGLVWRWVDGEPLSYTNWAPGEPNSLGTELCVMTNWLSPGLWNNGTCWDTRLAIVEWEPVWSGHVTFPLKITSAEKDPASEDKTFVVSNQSFTGRITLYGDSYCPLGMPQHCFAEFLSDDPDETLVILINNLAVVSTETRKSKSEKALLTGTGDFMIKHGGTVVSSGFAYVDAQGTLKEDSSNTLLSIGLKGKVAGGVDTESVFSGNFNVTLTK